PPSGTGGGGVASRLLAFPSEPDARDGGSLGEVERPVRAGLHISCAARRPIHDMDTHDPAARRVEARVVELPRIDRAPEERVSPRFDWAAVKFDSRDTDGRVVPVEWGDRARRHLAAGVGPAVISP